MIEVIEPGMYATIQDFGRLGYLKKGLTRGGPIDENAFLWGNYLLKNEAGAAQIEIVLAPRGKDTNMKNLPNSGPT